MDPMQCRCATKWMFICNDVQWGNGLIVDFGVARAREEVAWIDGDGWMGAP